MSNDKKGKAKPGNKLPKEAVKFAKSMGLDLTGLEPEAEDIWRMLNNMAEKDSIGYHEFVRQQMEAAKAEDARGKAGEGTSSVDAVQRSFRPKAGFCISAFTCDGDGLKVRDLMGDGKLAGKVLYINFCSSGAIEVPVDRYGKEIQEGRLNADGLSIPLAIGKQRDIENSKSIAIDVVVHPRVLDNASTERVFRRQLIELGLDWIQQETELRMRLNTAPDKVQDKIEWKDVEDGRKYVGGRGDDEDIPVLFMVEYGENSSSGDVKKGSTAKSAGSTDGAPLLASPASLLSQLERETTSSSDVQGSIRIPGTAPVPAAPSRDKAAVSGTGQSQRTNINNINSNGKNNNNNNSNNNNKKVDLNFLASNSARNDDNEKGSCFVGRDLRVSGTGKKQGKKSKLIQVVGADNDKEDDYNSDTDDIVVDDSLNTSTSEGSGSKSSKEDESFESIFKRKFSTKGLDLGNSAAAAVGSNKQAGSASAFGFGNDKSGKSSKSSEKAYAKPTPKESREMDVLLANLDSDEAWLAELLTREAQSSSQEEQLQQSISYLSDLAKVLTPGVPGAVNTETGRGINNNNNNKVQEIVDSLPYKLPDVESISSSSLGAHKGGARGGVVGGIVVDPSSSAAAGKVSPPKGLGTLSRAELMAAVEAINRGQLVVSNPFQTSGSGNGFDSTMPSSSSNNNNNNNSNNSWSSLLKASAKLKLVDITADMNGSVQLAICIEGFVSTLDTSKLDLQVSGDTVRIQIAALSDIAAVAGSTALLAAHSHSAHSSTSNSVGVGGGGGGAIGVRYLGKELNFDPKTTKASFKKKKGLLMVTINTKFRN